MLSFDDALHRILAAVPAPVKERCPIGEAAGQVLAAPVVARHDQPPFHASAMDGYAVISGSVEAGKAHAVVGESQAGGGLTGKIASGEAARIFTGAPLPDGTDAVIIQENADRDGDRAVFSQGVSAGENVRPRGQDFAKGQVLLEPGHILGPAACALAAAGNVDEVDIYRRPRLALFSTGDELVPPGSDLQPGQIIGSNSYALKPLFAPYTREIADLGNAPDDENRLRAHFEGALAGDAQIIVSSGGASVGEHDLVQPVLRSLGVEVDFWKIAMRPGKPLMFGKWREKLLFALPGNPVSAFVTALMLVVPALRAAAGCADPAPKMLSLPLAGSLSANGPRRHFVRARLVTDKGQTAAQPFAQTDSAHLTTLAAADLLIVQPEDQQGYADGDVVQVVPIPGSVLA